MVWKLDVEDSTNSCIMAFNILIVLAPKVSSAMDLQVTFACIMDPYSMHASKLRSGGKCRSSKHSLTGSLTVICLDRILLASGSLR